MKKRVIPILTVENNRLVKTVKFKDRIYLGDPLNAIKVFNDKMVDELIILDIGKKIPDQINYKFLKNIADECFMPLTYGGGIASVKSAAKVFELGFEKICLQTAALSNTKLITELANQFGSQSIVCSVDILLDWKKTYCIYNYNLKAKYNNPNKIIRSFVDSGAGEIVINSINRDGLQSGPEFNLINSLEFFEVPIIYVGGISSLDDMNLVFEKKIDAIGAGAYFSLKKPHNAVLISYLHEHDFNYLDNIT